MNSLDQVLFGQEIPDSECSSSEYENTIFTPLNQPSPAYRNAPGYSATTKTPRKYVDISNYKSASCFSVRSQEVCTKVWESLKMRKIPHYESRVHLADQAILADKIAGRHDHDRCVRAQRPLRSYCEAEYCPMSIFRDSMFEELFTGPRRYLFERFETTPRYSVVESSKFWVRTKVRNAVSRVQLLFGANETRAERRYRMAQERVKEYHWFLHHDPDQKPLVETYSEARFAEVLDGYYQRIEQIRSYIP